VVAVLKAGWIGRVDGWIGRVDGWMEGWVGGGRSLSQVFGLRDNGVKPAEFDSL